MSVKLTKESENLSVIRVDRILTFNDQKEIEKRLSTEIDQKSKYKILVLTENFSGWSKDGDWLDGSNTYELVVPPYPPAKDFWSIAVYNNKLRNLVDNETRNAIVNNKGNIKTEPDGSVKVYIGPEAPAGYESNWVQSIKGEGFFTYLRLYGPTEAYFDKSWKMPDFVKIK